MIYTVTLNPSLDYIVELDQVSIGELNRTTNESKFPGGKGINVSQVLNNLDVKISGSGDVNYWGAASITNADISGSGKIKKNN